MEVVPAGAILFRCHDSGRTAVQFNPGHGRFRWSFFGTPAVPALYLASSTTAAFAETVLHDARPGELLDATLYMSRAITAIRVRRPLRLACLHSHGLKALGLHARDLTDTDSSAYPGTVAWAEAVHDDNPDLAGIVWMSRQWNTDRAMCLFGDRVTAADLEVVADHADNIDFAGPGGADWAIVAAADAGIWLQPPG